MGEFDKEMTKKQTQKYKIINRLTELTGKNKYVR
jgi:hypothetical protein